MDKIVWLKQMTVNNPEDPQSWYWLGMELTDRGQALEAVGAFTEALKHADESLRGACLDGLARATAVLQGTARPAAVNDAEPGPAEEVRGVNESGGGGSRDDHTSAGERRDENAVGDGQRDGQDTGGEGHPSSVEDRDVPAAAVNLFRAKTRPGLQVVQGGRSEGAGQVEPSQVTFADVAGLTELKKTIRMRIISPFFNQGLFSKFRKKAGGGVLLYGPPGCGKTFMAKATAGEVRASFINVHITDILDPYIGVSEQNLKDLFDKARFQKPSVMFFDEVDAIGYNRSKSTSHLRGLVDTFLTQMEGMDTTTDQVLIIGATNMPWDVDNALKRPGRFDRLIFVAPPDLEARVEMFRLKLAGRYIGNVDCDRLGRMTEFYSGADIENACERAAEAVLEEILDTGTERPIETADLERAIAAMQPSTLEWLRTAKNYVKYANQSGLYNDVEQYLKKHAKLL